MWHTIGHDKAVNVLRRSLDEGRLSHAYLLAGPQHVGKMTLALDLARAVNCLEDERPCDRCSQCLRIARALHADVRVVGIIPDKSAEGRSHVVIKLDQIREVQREASLKPYEGAYRVFIVDGAEHLSEEAANCLLKTLEEPPDQVILVLLTSDSKMLAPTVVSRCQVLELRPVPMSLISRELETKYEADGNKAAEIARLAQGRPGSAMEAVARPDLLDKLSERLGSIEDVISGSLEERFAYAENLASSTARDRELGRQELAIWLAWWRDVLLVKEKVPAFATHISRMETLKVVADALSSTQVVRAINAVRETMEHLERNVNLRLALEDMMLALPRLQEGVR